MRSAVTADPLAAMPARGGELDLTVLAGALWKRRVWIIGPTIVALVAAAALVSMITPRYKSEAHILLQSQETTFTRPTADQPQRDQQQLDEQAVRSEIQLIMSRELALKAAAKLELAGKPEFDPLATGLGTVKRLLISVGLVKDPLAKTPEERVLDNYFESLTAYSIDKSRVIAIEFSSNDPQLAATAANTIADLYIAAQSANKRSNSQDASETLSPQIADLRQKVAKAEDAVEEFRAKNGLFSSQTNGTLSSQQLTEINAQLSSARSQQAESQAKASMIREMLRNGRPVEVTDVTNNELMRRLAEQRVNLQTQLALESRTLLPGHPRIKELKAQLDDLVARIAVEGQKTVRALENDARIAGARVTSLEAALESQKGHSATSNEKEVELRALEREAKAQRDLLETYLARYREAASRAAVELLPPDARIISKASPSNTPYFPKPAPIIFIATFATFVLALALCCASELLSGRAFVGTGSPTPGESREQTDARAATLSARGAEPPLPVRSSDPLAALPVMRSVQWLAERVMQQHRSFVRGAPRRIVVTGMEVGAEIGATATELGRILSNKGLRTVLVDLNAGGSASASAVPGLGDLIAGHSSFVEIIHRDTASQAHVIPAGRSLRGLQVEIIAQRMGVVFDALSSTYQVVLFNAPVVEGATSGIQAVSIAGACESVVLLSSGHQEEARTAADHAALLQAGASDIIVFASGEADGAPMAGERNRHAA